MTVKWPEVGDFGWGEQLLASLQELEATGLTIEIDVTKSPFVVESRAAVIVLMADRQAASEVKFALDGLRVVVNKTMAAVQVGPWQLAHNETGLFAFSEGKPILLAQVGQEAPMVEIIGRSGLLVRPTPKGYDMEVDFSKVPDIHMKALAARLKEYLSLDGDC